MLEFDSICIFAPERRFSDVGCLIEPDNITELDKMTTLVAIISIILELNGARACGVTNKSPLGLGLDGISKDLLSRV